MSEDGGLTHHLGLTGGPLLVDGTPQTSIRRITAADRAEFGDLRVAPATGLTEEAGEENLFLFGLTAEQVAGSRGWYDPRWHYEHEEETRQALDLIFSGHFNRGEPGLYDPIRDALLDRGDYDMHLADLGSDVSAQSRVSDLYADRQRWSRKAILNVARSGKFSSDRTIAEYAESIWRAKPCPVD